MIAAAYSRALAPVLVADPGLLRLRNAARSTLASLLTATIGVSWAVQHQQHVTVAAFGALFAMIAPLFLRDVRLSSWLVSLICLYLCACTSFAISAAVAAYPLLRDAGLLLVVFTGMLCQPYGPRAVGCGLLALVVFYLGLYLHPAPVQLAQMLTFSAAAPAIVALAGRILIPMRSGRTPPLTAGALLRRASRVIARFNLTARRAGRLLKAAQRRERGFVSSRVSRSRRSNLAWLPAAPATIAAALAMLIGNGLSEERWMWAVISTFVVFLGTTSREHTLSRVVQRLAGTLAGALASVLLVTAFRAEPWLLITAMALSVFGWAYYILHAYARGVFFITVLVGLVYGQLGLAIVPLAQLRVEEVIVGCLVSVVVAVLMMPPAAARRVDAGVLAGR